LYSGKKGQLKQLENSCYVDLKYDFFLTQVFLNLFDIKPLIQLENNPLKKVK